MGHNRRFVMTIRFLAALACVTALFGCGGGGSGGILGPPDDVFGNNHLHFVPLLLKDDATGAVLTNHSFGGGSTVLTVRIVNSGNRETGPLTATLSGSGASSFQLSSSIPSIGAGSSGLFTVTPDTGVNANATVTIRDGVGRSYSFTVVSTGGPIEGTIELIWRGDPSLEFTYLQTPDPYTEIGDEIHIINTNTWSVPVNFKWTISESTNIVETNTVAWFDFFPGEYVNPYLSLVVTAADNSFSYSGYFDIQY
ncbi:hypothetical protein FACS1894161_1350 [Spirochaetia bacterium]|nr:hypothetical protein FACS1894161_1350 [Spirochaetia bacterium]